MNDLSCDKRMWAQVSFVLSQSTRLTLTNGRRDRKTDRKASVAIPITVRCITCSRTVKTVHVNDVIDFGNNPAQRRVNSRWCYNAKLNCNRQRARSKDRDSKNIDAEVWRKTDRGRATTVLAAARAITGTSSCLAGLGTASCWRLPRCSDTVTVLFLLRHVAPCSRQPLNCLREVLLNKIHLHCHVFLAVTMFFVHSFWHSETQKHNICKSEVLNKLSQSGKYTCWFLFNWFHILIYSNFTSILLVVGFSLSRFDNSLFTLEQLISVQLLFLILWIDTVLSFVQAYGKVNCVQMFNFISPRW